MLKDLEGKLCSHRVAGISLIGYFLAVNTRISLFVCAETTWKYLARFFLQFSLPPSPCTHSASHLSPSSRNGL